MIENTHVDAISDFDLSENGQYVIVSSYDLDDNWAILYEIPDKFTGQTEVQWNITHSDREISSISITDKGTRAIMACYPGGGSPQAHYFIYGYSNSATTELWTIPGRYLYDAKISGNGEYVVFKTHSGSGDYNLVLWEVTTQTTKWNYSVSGDLYVNYLDINTDGSIIAAALSRETIICFGKDSVVPLWNKTLYSGLDFNYYSGIAVSDDGSTIATSFSISGVGEEIFLFDTESGDELWSSPFEVSSRSYALSATGDLLAGNHPLFSSTDNKIAYFNRSSNEAAWEIDMGSTAVSSCDLSADGKLGILGCDGGRILIVDCVTGSVLMDQDTRSTVNRVEISGEGSIAVAYSSNGFIYGYTIESPEKTAPINSNPIDFLSTDMQIGFVGGFVLLAVVWFVLGRLRK
jgi:outer membrane protein assembly factor BamB